jgi:5,10-methylenetetrahydromethanopterin reductase
MHTSRFPELGFYLLPGHAEHTSALLEQARLGETLGFGSAWISERFDAKEAAVCVGAAAAVTSRIVIGTAATNVSTRHPMVMAAMATTANRLSQGRFALGVARGIGVREPLWGIKPTSNRHLADFVSVMKRLWNGERVFGYDGPLGQLHYAHLADWIHEDIPILFAGFGPKSIEAAGGVFDGVILHTFLSDAALERAVAHIRRGAEHAGRDPKRVKVWAVLAVACDPSEEMRLRYLVARMGTYMQAPGYGEGLCAINQWDTSVLERFRKHDLVSQRAGSIDSTATLDELREIEKLIPPDWLPAATGNAARCAERIADQFRAGADGVILHASTPDELAPVLEAYAPIRDSARFAARTNRPA